MVISTTTGYILEVEGPFLSNSKNSDAHILGKVLAEGVPQSKLDALSKPSSPPTSIPGPNIVTGKAMLMKSDHRGQVHDSVGFSDDDHDVMSADESVSFYFSTFILT